MLKHEDMVELYVQMVRVRKSDDVMCALHEEKRAHMFPSSRGAEAVGVGAVAFLRKNDYLSYQHRGLGLPYLLPKGVPLQRFFAEVLFKTTGTCQGLAYQHTAAPEVGILGYTSLLGAKPTISTGYGMAAKLRGHGQIALCAFGDGEACRGNTHEALNLSAVLKLPVVWVVDNNQMQWLTPTKDARATDDVADIATGHGIPAVVVDGLDVLAVHEAVQGAVDRARDGMGPSLIECKTYRIGPHDVGMKDLTHDQPRSLDEQEKWAKRDPIDTYREDLLDQGVLSQADVTRIDREVQSEVDDALAFADASPPQSRAILAERVYFNSEGTKRG